MTFKLNSPIDIIRIMAALMMLIHGVARISIGIVDDFGEFLNGMGFPLGLYLAWLITIVEVIGSICIIFNYFTSYISAFFIFQLMMGIALVHVQDGWFVVGAGRNGIEYSVALIVCFFATIWNEINTKK